MQLIADDRNQVYYWVESDNHSVRLSPHFDYEEDALAWFQRIAVLSQQLDQATA
ncbi:hypothetical protein UFOVP116_227 [uncultured Caudovirales phage]|uniref:Uncharacterized protein n=1 Tax=uncultured Caudovirales phage TaxID=2100421 RepID=A0A6J5L7N2_9CAUD|nr:hypothetical protein UFOVP116_227 [uncultured Caudovirales phage]